MPSLIDTTLLMDDARPHADTPFATSVMSFPPNEA
jgi:hypothetical protein